MNTVKFIIDHIDLILIIPTMIFIALSGSLKAIYGDYCIRFSLVFSFSLPLALIYIGLFSFPHSARNTLAEEAGKSLIQVIALSPQAIILLIAGFYTLARFRRSEPITLGMLGFTLVVAVLGHLWTRTALSGL